MITNVIAELTGIPNLEPDEYLHGAGLHVHPRNGRLQMHLDYEKHPYSGKERRINIIIYLSKDWRSEWKGATELWDNDLKNCIVKSHVQFNTAIIFKTNNASWHGLPEKILCPENVFRKTLAFYYVSEPNNYNNEYRKKATYKKRHDEPYDENMDQLYKIRPFRRITKEDMDSLFPGWTPEL
jgi:hypothetical protein